MVDSGGGVWVVVVVEIVVGVSFAWVFLVLLLLWTVALDDFVVEVVVRSEVVIRAGLVLIVFSTSDISVVDFWEVVSIVVDFAWGEVSMVAFLVVVTSVSSWTLFSLWCFTSSNNNSESSQIKRVLW